MRVGVDSKKLPGSHGRTPLEVLDHVKALGLDGVFFRTVLDMSAKLDLGELREIRAHADELGLYLEAGTGKVNPFNTAETPEVRELGDGDYRLGMERMIRACCEIGCQELWACTASYQKHLKGLYAFDRFRTDVAWTEQLQATERFLRLLAPVLRELGSHLNIETHEEITTFELVRLIEAVGPDVVGVTLDVANVLIRGEDPLAAATRVAPYVRQTHMKDAVLYFVDEGLARQVRPCGQGMIDWAAILPVLTKHAPDLHLSVEVHDPRHVMAVPIFDALWQNGHPDLTVAELAQVVRQARICETRVARGELCLLAPPDGAIDAETHGLAFVQDSTAFLRSLQFPAAASR